jgi:SAM-dependent methyltransferase
VAESRDVLDGRPGSEGEVPEALVSRGWSDFLLSLDDQELASVETDGLEARWPERAPPSLRALALRAHEVCSMSALVPAGAPATGPRPGETPRKRAQIDAFRALVRPFVARATRVVDIGSGHGHLTRAIAEGSDRPVIGLERDAVLAARARARAAAPAGQGIGRNTTPEGRGPSFVVTDVLRDGLTPLAGDCFVGLHACGELGDMMVQTVAGAPGTSLALVGCCLQKRRQLSRLPLCPVPGTGEQLELPRRLLGLSNLTARDAGVEASRLDNLAARERRLALHRLLAHRFGPIHLGAEIEGLNRRVAQRELAFLVARAFAHRGAPAPPVAAIDEAARWAREAHARARRLCLPRALLARVLEVYVLLDRAVFLERSGFVVRVGTAFPLDLSARNLALVAGEVRRSSPGESSAPARPSP